MEGSAAFYACAGPSHAVVPTAAIAAAAASIAAASIAVAASTTAH